MDRGVWAGGVAAIVRRGEVVAIVWSSSAFNLNSKTREISNHVRPCTYIQVPTEKNSSSLEMMLALT